MFKRGGEDGRKYTAKLVDFGLSVHIVRTSRGPCFELVLNKYVNNTHHHGSAANLNLVPMAHLQKTKEGSSKSHKSRLFQGTLSHMVGFG